MVWYKVRIDEAEVVFADPKLAEAQALEVAREDGACDIEVIYPTGGGYRLRYDGDGNMTRLGRNEDV